MQTNLLLLYLKVLANTVLNNEHGIIAFSNYINPISDFQVVIKLNYFDHCTIWMLDANNLHEEM